MRYMIEGFAREVGSIGIAIHVCYFVEADDPDKATDIRSVRLRK